jgi:hypothetical protein
MLFKGEEGEKNTNALSGGEAVRLMFAKLMLTRKTTSWSSTSPPTTSTSSPSWRSGRGAGALRRHRPGPRPSSCRTTATSSAASPRALFAFTPPGLVDFFAGAYED